MGRDGFCVMVGRMLKDTAFLPTPVSEFATSDMGSLGRVYLKLLASRNTHSCCLPPSGESSREAGT